MTSSPLTRPIPSTGEQIPAIGIGSYQTFDVSEPRTVQPVLARFLELGGSVIDTSPMYARSEAAIGTVMTALRKANPKTPTPWLATKVWTSGKDEGLAQMKKSLQRLGTPLDQDVNVEWVQDEDPGVVAVHFTTARGPVRID